MKKAIYILVLFLVLAGIFYGTQSMQSDLNTPDTIRLGVLLPLSGTGSAFGEEIRDGIQLAFADTTVAGKFSLTFEDTFDFSTLNTLTAYKKLVSIDDVDTIIGPVGPEASLGLLYSNSVSTTTTIYSVSQCDSRMQEFPNLYCAYPSVIEQAYANEGLLQFLGSKHIYIITENGVLGDNYVETLETVSARNNISIEGISRVTSEQREFSTEVTKILAENPDAVLIAMTPGNDVTLLKQLKEQDYRGNVLFSSDKTEEELRSMALPEHFYIPVLVSKNYDPDFTQKFKETYNVEPGFYHALGHSIAASVLNDVLGATISPAINEFRFTEDNTVSLPMKPMIFKDDSLTEVRIDQVVN
jgi:branched-chain amino acid transport system substrate-binding protein